MQSATYRDLLRGNINFRRLWFGQMISELGTWFSFIAELGTVSLLSKSPLATMALLVSRLLPVLLMAPLAGVLVDRASRKTVLIVTDLIRALLALGLLSSAYGAPLWFVILCSGLMAASTTFFEAAKNASIANMVTRQEMLTANVLMFSTRFLQLTLGAALGGMTAAVFGYKVAFIINSLSFIGSAIFIWWIPAGVMRQEEVSGASANEAESAIEVAPQPANRFWTDVRDGLSYIRRTPFVRAVIMVNVGWATGGGMNTLLFDRIARHEFAVGIGDRGDWAMAVLTTAAGAGLFVGMMLARRAGAWAAEEKRAGRFIGWALFIHGLWFATAGLMPTLGWMALFFGISRMLLGAEFGFQETLMMRVIPDDFRGRVFTTDRALELSMMTISMVFAGSVLTWVGPRTMIVVSGILSAGPGIIWLLALWKRGFAVPAQAIREAHV